MRSSRTCSIASARPKLVTTDGEFHTLRRLLARLAEERRRAEEAARLGPAELRLVIDTASQSADVRTSGLRVGVRGGGCSGRARSRGGAAG